MLTFDAHIHAAPSSSARWGTDLDLVDAAAAHGVRGFVLKSHHEQTASRAIIARAYAERRQVDCSVFGAVVVNPWMALTEIDRALDLGARCVWWPTRDELGRPGPFALPARHREVLELLSGRTDLTIGTGHLDLSASVDLVTAARSLGFRAVVTHALNPDVGVGVDGAIRLGELGAAVEVDCLSLSLLRGRGDDAAALVTKLVASCPDTFLVSDAGQARNGDPFSFAAREIRGLADRAGPAVLEALLEGTRAEQVRYGID